MKRQQSLEKGHNTDNECPQNWSQNWSTTMWEPVDMTFTTHMAELNAWEQESVRLTGYNRARFAEELEGSTKRVWYKLCGKVRKHNGKQNLNKELRPLDSRNMFTVNFMVSCWGPAPVDPGNSKQGQSQSLGKDYLIRNIKKLGKNSVVGKLVEERGWITWFTRKTNNTSRQEVAPSMLGHRHPLE